MFSGTEAVAFRSVTMAFGSVGQAVEKVSITFSAIRGLRYALFVLIALAASAMVVTGYRSITTRQVSSSCNINFDPSRIMHSVAPKWLMKRLGYIY
jgi:hypothetical protein